MERDPLRSSFDQALGRYLAELREAKSLSQEWLAQQIGKDQPFVSKVERGQRRVTVADLLAWIGALGIPLSAVAEDLERLQGR